MEVCGAGGGIPSPPPTGDCLCSGDVNALTEELEPLWLTALFLKVKLCSVLGRRAVFATSGTREGPDLGFGWVVSASAGWDGSGGVWSGLRLVWMSCVVFAVAQLWGGVCWWPAICLPAQSVVGELGHCMGVLWRAVGCVGLLQCAGL